MPTSFSPMIQELLRNKIKRKLTKEKDILL